MSIKEAMMNTAVSDYLQGGSQNYNTPATS